MKIVLLIVALASVSLSTAQAQGKPPTAKDAVDTLARLKGGAYLGQVVQIFGNQGQDQPAVWVVIAREPKRPTVLIEYQFHAGRMISQKAIKEAYSLKLTGPNIPMPDVNLDSNGLFRLADREAKAARLGFDSIDYELRCRELSTEPIWVVNLRDRESRNVGVLFVSAKTSSVIRRLWNQRPAPAVAHQEARPANVQNVQPARQLPPPLPPNVPPTTYKAKKPTFLDKIKETLSGNR